MLTSINMVQMCSQEQADAVLGLAWKKHHMKPGKGKWEPQKVTNALRRVEGQMRGYYG